MVCYSAMPSNESSYIQVNIYGVKLTELESKGADISSYLKDVGINNCIILEVPIKHLVAKLEILDDSQVSSQHSGNDGMQQILGDEMMDENICDQQISGFDDDDMMEDEEEEEGSMLRIAENETHEEFNAQLFATADNSIVEQEERSDSILEDVTTTETAKNHSQINKENTEKDEEVLPKAQSAENSENPENDEDQDLTVHTAIETPEDDPLNELIGEEISNNRFDDFDCSLDFEDFDDCYDGNTTVENVEQPSILDAMSDIVTRVENEMSPRSEENKEEVISITQLPQNVETNEPFEFISPLERTRMDMLPENENSVDNVAESLAETLFRSMVNMSADFNSNSFLFQTRVEDNHIDIISRMEEERHKSNIHPDFDAIPPTDHMTDISSPNVDMSFYSDSFAQEDELNEKPRVLRKRKAMAPEMTETVCQHPKCNRKIRRNIHHGSYPLLEHVRTHAKTKMRGCKECDFLGSIGKTVKYHFSKKHPNKEWRGYVDKVTPEGIQELTSLWDVCFPGETNRNAVRCLTILPNHRLPRYSNGIH